MRYFARAGVGGAGRLLLAGLLLGMVCLAGGGEVWAQAQEAPATQAAKEGAKPAGKGGAHAPEGENDKQVVLKAVPTNIQISGNVSFNENGAMTGQNSYFNIGFSLQPPGNMPIRALRNVKVKKLVTDSGEDLAAGLREQNNENFQMPEDLFLAPGQDANRGRGGRRQTYVTPPFPKRACRKIAKMTGTADIEMAQGPLKRVNVGLVSAVDGKRIKIDGMEDGWIQFAAMQEGNQRRMQVTSNMSTMGKLARLYFFNGDGTLIQNQGYSTGYSGQGNGTVTLGLYGQFGEATTAVMIVYSSSKTMSVTFEGTDFPLPQIFSEGSDLFDMVLKPEPIEEGFALADIAPKAVHVKKSVEIKDVKPVIGVVEVGRVPVDIKTLEEVKFTQEDAPVAVDKVEEKAAVEKKEAVKGVEKKAEDVKAKEKGAQEKVKAEAVKAVPEN